jgi:hypothetical protein
VFNPNLVLVTNYDKATSEMRGLSPKIISGDSQRSENTQTQHIIAYNTIYEV